MWIYVFGERDGADIKIGHTRAACVSKRLKTVNGSQTTDESYVMLAAVNSSKTGEDVAKAYFDRGGLLRQDKGRRTEYFTLDESLIEWVLWLRQEWYVSFDPDDELEDSPEIHYSDWIPTPTRRTLRPPTDPSRLIQDQQMMGHLAGTAWAWMPDMTASFQDYFTPPDLIERAMVAMGGIDGDAASHWIAQKRLRQAGVLVPEYLHNNKSAFTHDWFKRTWLNPPYGENDRWFRRAIEMMDSGKTEQLCMLSPIYVFTTGISEEIMARSSAAIILSPTPKFYNPAFPKGYDPETGKSKDGTNLPHAIIYWGHRRREFLEAYRGTGIPVTVSWDDISAEEMVYATTA